MKKLLFLFTLLSFIGLGSVSAQSFTMVGNGVTLTNTGTVACSLKVSNNYSSVTVQAVFTKTSGTLGGTATLQGSVDGVTWETIPTSLVAGVASTYTVTDVASQGKSFVITGSPFLHYRISWTGTGTMVGTVACFVLPRNYNK